VVELAADQPCGQPDRFQIDAATATDRRVDGDAQRAPAELRVVEVELEVGDDGRDQGTDTLEVARFTHFSTSFLTLGAGDTGPSSKEGVGLMSPRLQFGELQRPAEYSGRPVVFAVLQPPLAAPRSEVSCAPNVDLFLRTLREDPVDAEVASHRLLVRGGYIRRARPRWVHLVAAGLDGVSQHRARGA